MPSYYPQFHFHFGDRMSGGCLKAFLMTKRDWFQRVFRGFIVLPVSNSVHVGTVSCQSSAPSSLN